MFSEVNSNWKRESIQHEFSRYLKLRLKKSALPGKVIKKLNFRWKSQSRDWEVYRTASRIILQGMCHVNVVIKVLRRKCPIYNGILQTFYWSLRTENSVCVVCVSLKCCSNWSVYLRARELNAADVTFIPNIVCPIRF